MKVLKKIYIAATALATVFATGCTNLDETLYDQVGSQNYYNTQMDVVRATFRPFEHAFWSIQSRHVLNELSADQLITPTRDGWWDDGGRWRRCITIRGRLKTAMHRLNGTDVSKVSCRPTM